MEFDTNQSGAKKSKAPDKAASEDDLRTLPLSEVEKQLGASLDELTQAEAVKRLTRTGVRACLIHENFSAHQGVEDDDLNLICFGGRVVGDALAWELTQTFLTARFVGAERFRRRLAKVAELENCRKGETTRNEEHAVR